ncbi:toll/interleukin-1 receptor domain-containing protein [Kordiimonas sp. SCSIO 12603]|uniref:toll/interleukin-1 receptor domain-containing protein n=1 Tax=Kordiimonas sp. SCSIO 12603 TaxID=2829596 RepID=UPI0021031B0C|nr:toll/interleukin-1 receptor domain-containing protein [Kordiimonas sp. SCSIO 12603]UTW59326.1 toll/interleukin-1 receptor domain-containing protein [Kordiimonas sp. SCSIO 12603]
MSNYKYKAFISYSHKDAALGEEIHKELEKYKVPKRLVGKATAVGVVPLKLGQFFRDREELPVAEDLTTEVAKALGQSEFMIVLCSPSAAASRWVNKEIIEFKKLRGEKYVLPLILSGEPWASDTDDKEAECFPPALRYRISPAGTLSHIRTEPIAADIREQSDGRKRGIQKLIAGLLGVGLDQLVERELQRKQRRVMAITSASVLGMIVMGALTYQATTARNAAERHRAEAEDLIEFMLTDLRKKLEPVGRLDVLDAVGTKAVDYYNAQDLDDVSDDAMGRRSRAFHMLGEIQNSRGNLQQADVMFKRANAATEGLFERDPSDPQRIYEHSQSIYWVGHQAWQLGDYTAAEIAWRKYKELSQQLVSIDPSNIDWQFELAYAHSNVGTLQLINLHQPKKAHESFTRSLKVFEGLRHALNDDIDLEYEIADTHGWIADSLLQFGHAKDVRTARELQKGLLEKLEQKDPLNKTVQTMKVIPFRALGNLSYSEGNYQEAIRHFTQAVELATQLSISDLENRRWRSSLGIAYIELSSVLLTTGDLLGAQEVFSEAEEIAAALLGQDKANLEETIYLEFKLAFLEYELRKVQKELSFDAVQEAQAILDKVLLQAEKLKSSTAGRSVLTTGYVNVILALHDADQLDDAQIKMKHIWGGQSVLGELTDYAGAKPSYLKQLLTLAKLNGNLDLQNDVEQSLLNRGYAIE